MLSTLALRTGSLRAALRAKQIPQLMTRLISSTRVLQAEGPDSLYLTVKGEVKEEELTDEERFEQTVNQLESWKYAHQVFYGPHRDFENFPHPQLVDVPDKHHLGIIPHSWFKACYPRLGVTGGYTLTWGLILTLHSKEIIVIDHGYGELVILAVLFTYTNYRFGPRIAEWLDKKREERKQRIYDIPKEEANTKLRKYMAEAEEKLWRQEAVPVIYDAKKENIALQLESQYRERLHHVHAEVKKRLDYQLEIQSTQRQFEQKHMVNWIVNNVIKSITPQQEKESIANCIQTLKKMSATASL